MGVIAAVKWGGPPSRLLEGLFKRAGVYRKGKLLHAMRHTAATEWLGEGADLETVRALLGHRHILTTAIYVHATADRMRKAVERADAGREAATQAPGSEGKDASVLPLLLPNVLPST